MSKTKKIVALLLSCLLAGSALAGCGNGSSSTADSSAPTESSKAEDSASTEESTSQTAAGGDATLRVAWWGNQVRNDGTVAALNLYSEQNPGIKFETEFTDWTGYWDKMATQAAAGSLPDIIQQDYKYYVQYQSKGQLASMNPFIDSGVLDISDASENIIESGRVDGELYALCIGINAPAMVYDKEVAAEAGVEIKNGMTQSEFLDAAQKIYDTTGKKYDWGYNDGENLYEYFVRGQGKVLFQSGKLGIESAAELVPFFQRLVDSVATEAHMTAAECSEAVGVGVEQDPLSVGKAWMSLSYSNMLVAFNNGAGKELGMVTWPVGDNDTTKAMYLKPGQFFSITNTSENQEEAAKVLNFFTNSVECNEILLAERGVPISSKVAEAIKPQMDTGNQMVFDYISEVEEYCSTINPPSPEGMGEVLTLCNDMVEQVCYGQMTAEQAAEKFFTEANAILAKSAQ